MVFRPLAGCGLFRQGRGVLTKDICFRPLAGCGLFRASQTRRSSRSRYPSPCGVWVVSVSVRAEDNQSKFPSPCGVWVVSTMTYFNNCANLFPSPCGVWVVSEKKGDPAMVVSVPLRGVGCFYQSLPQSIQQLVSVPLRGVGCFAGLLIMMMEKGGGSVPLRGVGCFVSDRGVEQCRMVPSPCGVWVVSCLTVRPRAGASFRPLAGCGLFLHLPAHRRQQASFRPLAGCGLFRQSCTFFLVQQEKELSTLLFYCIILADVYQ